MKTIRKMKVEKAARSLEVSVEMIVRVGRSGLVSWWICVKVCWMEEECRMIGR